MKKFSLLGISALFLLGLAVISLPLGVRFSGYLCMGIAVLWAIGLLLRRWAGGGSRAGRICFRLFLLGISLGTAALITIESAVIFYGERDGSSLPVDAVIVLGAGVNGETPSLILQSRIRAAAAYLQGHPDVPVVLSGGRGPGESITEAEAMRRALWTNSEERNSRYLLEEESANTAENFAFSKAVLEQYGLDLDTASVAVITNDFHCFRAGLIARRLGLHTVSIPAEQPWWLTGNYYLREAFAVVKTALFDWF